MVDNDTDALVSKYRELYWLCNEFQLQPDNPYAAEEVRKISAQMELLEKQIGYVPDC